MVNINNIIRQSFKKRISTQIILLMSTNDKLDNK